MLMRLLAWVYGTVNIAAAALIYFNFSMPSAAAAVLVGVLLFKGIPSLAGDLLCKVDGVVDITAALSLVGFVVMPDPFRFFVVLMLVWVGILSFF